MSLIGIAVTWDNQGHLEALRTVEIVVFANSQEKIRHKAMVAANVRAMASGGPVGAQS